MATTLQDLSAMLGRVVAWLRDLYKLRQEDLAEAALLHGLEWTQATVTGLETGRRRLTAVELLLLPDVISTATLDRFSLVDLFELAAEKVTLTPALRDVPSEDLIGFAEGRRAHASRARDDVELADARAAERLGVEVAAVRKAARKLWRRPLAEELAARVEIVVEQTKDTPRERRTLRVLLERPLLEDLGTQLGTARDRTA